MDAQLETQDYSGFSEELQLWLSGLHGADIGTILNKLIAEDCVFYSPVIHAPQTGKQLTFMYLYSAYKVLLKEGKFSYRRIVEQGRDAVLEFETELDGIYVNGVDMMRFNEAGQITEFKVMLRPMKALEKTRQLMMEQLEALK
ncbi:SnoaL-like protein [Roseibium hamelinense]|uniref:SnoaL-like protein n=1 Tax=Roseibium hamelinense TaxID=150831 RepID=A0A562T8G2_9HYPH|nr:nuclear transport factor 2 family protein [Roseibium hamelinense]MTI42809.1 nuclear transport factor 2 family protein [Roseibium hamelinense]TWI89474.1 SnoaL-like protein [Roseibium hamelinense]